MLWGTMQALPPLDCLRFFDAAARHENFVRAAEELQVTPAAVAHRIREGHLRAPLFALPRLACADPRVRT